jgi:Uma2 family endonuclease
MSTIVLDSQRVQIPAWVDDHSSFRRWVHSDEFPEYGRICYLGEVWVDMSKEQLTHNQAKGEVTAVLTRLAKETQSGRFFPDGYLLTNLDAELTTNPDGMFVLNESFRTGRVQLVEGVDEGYVELQGSPDMVLEIISPSSAEKDLVRLRNLYAAAGIPEYWLMDVRGEKAELTILRQSGRGYSAVRKSSIGTRSSVFAQSFSLKREVDAIGFPEFELSVR